MVYMDADKLADLFEDDSEVFLSEPDRTDEAMNSDRGKDAPTADDWDEYVENPDELDWPAIDHERF